MSTKKPSIHEDSQSKAARHVQPRSEHSENVDDGIRGKRSDENASPKISISNNSIHLPKDDDTKSAVGRSHAAKSRRPSVKGKAAEEAPSAKAAKKHSNAVEAHDARSAENKGVIADDANTPSHGDPRKRASREQISRDRDLHEQDAHEQAPREQASHDDASHDRAASEDSIISAKGTVKRVHEPQLRHGDAQSHMAYDHMAQDGIERVRYLNGDVLSRPLKMPAKYRRMSYLLVLVAIAIGVAFLTYYLDTTINEPKREQQRMEERLEQDIALNLPDMISLLPMDDATILATLQASGDTIFDKSSFQGDTSALELIKLPPEVDLAQAGALYLKGINKLSGTEAALLLNGSWDLDVDRSKGMNMAIHYADFKSKTVDAAIQNALVEEGLDQTVLTESGTDNSGNTFATGNVEVGGITYAWKISALPLNEVYSVNGLPEDAIYVGIRFTS